MREGQSALARGFTSSCCVVPVAAWSTVAGVPGRGGCSPRGGQEETGRGQSPNAPLKDLLSEDLDTLWALQRSLSVISPGHVSQEIFLLTFI